MGRLKKYNTPEEKKEANKASVRKYYWKNKDTQDARSKLNYKKRKNGLLKNLQQDSSESKNGKTEEG